MKVNSDKTTPPIVNSDLNAPSAHTENVKISAGRDKTLQKRMTSSINSRLFIALALVSAVSAFASFFRGYSLAVTLVLALFRTAFSATLWTVFFTEGQKGLKALSLISLIQRIFFPVFFLFFAVFCSFAMFGVCITGSLFMSFARQVRTLDIFALVPILGLCALAYASSVVLKPRYLLFANIRDAFHYGFTFEKCSTEYIKNCIILSITYPVLYITGLILGSFTKLSFLPERLSLFLDRYLLCELHPVVSIFGLIFTSATFILSAKMTARYKKIIKVYKADKAKTKKKMREVMGN